MIVCSCNALSDRDVRASIQAAPVRPCTVSETYRCCGRTAQCGRCVPSLRRIMREMAVDDERRLGGTLCERHPVAA